MKNERKQPRNSLFFYLFKHLLSFTKKGRTVIRINRGKFNSKHMRRTLCEIESIRDFVWLIDWSIDKIVFINFLFEHKGTANRFICGMTLYRIHKLSKIRRWFRIFTQFSTFIYFFKSNRASIAQSNTLR